MIRRLTKFAVGTANLALIWLTWKFFRGELDWNLAYGALAISGFWLVLTAVRLRELFQTYFDTFSRLRVRVPLFTGLICSALSLYASHDATITWLAVAELVGWLGVYLGYRYTRKQFETVGHGPLPKGAWVNPPVDAIPNLSLVLTSGRIATRVHESVGHGEVPVDMPSGERIAFSSYMEKGVVLNPLSAIANAKVTRGHYIVLKLKQGVTPEQAARAAVIVAELKAINVAWRDEMNGKRLALIGRLPLPSSWRAWLEKKTYITGYDWPGLLIGTRSKVRWTCIGVCLELYERLGIKTNKYGTGFLGLGTGFLNPIMPVRFLADPAFELLTTADQAAYESARR